MDLSALDFSIGRGQRSLRRPPHPGPDDPRRPPNVLQPCRSWGQDRWRHPQRQGIIYVLF